MSVFINENTRLVVQGITGRDGSFHASQTAAYGTNLVAGVTPGKGGQTFEDKVPIFNTVKEAVEATQANASVLYVPAPFAADGICEAADAGDDVGRGVDRFGNPRRMRRSEIFAGRPRASAGQSGLQTAADRLPAMP